MQQKLFCVCVCVCVCMCVCVCEEGTTKEEEEKQEALRTYIALMAPDGAYYSIRGISPA